MKLKPEFVILLICLLAWALSLTASPARAALRLELSQARRDDQILAVIQSWLPRLEDEKDYRELQDNWSMVDPTGCENWFQNMHQTNPDNPMFRYLWLRTLDRWDEALDGAEALITAHPDYYWGYRLLAIEYPAMLSISRSSFGGHVARERMDSKESLYVDLLIKGEKLFENEPYILYALGEYYMSHDKWVSLEATALKLAQNSDPLLKSIYFTNQLCRFLESAEPARRILPVYISNCITNNKFPPEDSLKNYNSRLMTALFAAEDWPALDSLLASDSTLVTNRNYPYVAVPMLLNLGRTPEAIELARDLINRGYSIDNLEIYQHYYPEFEDTLWGDFEDQVPEYEELAHQQEEARLEQERLRQELPQLNIQDANGNPLDLSSYMGQKVFLLVWASWDEHCISQVRIWLEEDLEDSSEAVVLLVNGYDSDPARAQTVQSGFEPVLPYYRIDDASLELLDIKYLPAVIMISPDGMLDYLSDASPEVDWRQTYIFDLGK